MLGISGNFADAVEASVLVTWVGLRLTAQQSVGWNVLGKVLRI